MLHEQCKPLFEDSVSEVVSDKNFYFRHPGKNFLGCTSCPLIR